MQSFVPVRIALPIFISIEIIFHAEDAWSIGSMKIAVQITSRTFMAAPRILGTIMNIDTIAALAMKVCAALLPLIILGRRIFDGLLDSSRTFAATYGWEGSKLTKASFPNSLILELI